MNQIHKTAQNRERERERERERKREREREREIREIICTGNFLNEKHYPDLML